MLLMFCNPIPNLHFWKLNFQWSTNTRLIPQMDLRSKIIEIITVLILLAESAWVLFSLQHKLNQPTVQSRAMHLLIQYAFETEEHKKGLLHQAERERIYFWPGNGMPVQSQVSLTTRLDQVLSERYGEEYLSLPAEELKMMRESTLPWLEQVVLERADVWKSINFPENLEQWFALSKDEKSFIATSLVQMTRYTWLGYDKHLYFAVLPNQNGTLSLFLSAVADNVEILSFLEATWLQMLLLIVTLILFLVYNFKLLLDSRKILAITQIFEKFVPRQFLQKIATDGIENIQLGRAESDHVTVLFCDIRSFTSLSESMNPQEILNFLNSYFKHMNQPIAKKEGIIDKYVGDAIMAVFNFPEFDDKYEAERAVEAAIEMQYMLTEYNGFRKKTGYIPISNGTGIHSGSAVFGTVGSTDRMESTVLGDSVNVASRLEGLTKMFKTSIIISDKTQELIQDKNFLSRKLDRVSVVGRNEPMDIFEIFDYQEETIKDAKLKTLECFENSVEIYERGDWSEASHGFKECLKHFPEDSAASIYIGRCDMMINNPEVAIGWDGITHMKNK